MSTQSIIQLFGGIGLFLFSIKLISVSLQSLAGNRLRSLIAALTKTPVLGVIVGTFVTVLLQSSSATTVMTVSFVDAGLMTLKQAVGVIMGANIGTTITGQIIAFKVKDFAYLFVIAGVLLNFFGKSNNYKYFGNALFAFGLLFIGMQTMENSMSFLRSREDIFLKFSYNPLLGVLAGTVLTLLVQSSSATVGLTMALASQGLLPLEAAIPIILGDNVGTTITAIFASIGTSRTAKQTCAAHVLFNVFGVCIFLPLMPMYLPFLASTSDSIMHQIANAHTLFNVCNTLVFLPFAGPFANAIAYLIPAKAQHDESGAIYLDSKLLETSPIVAVTAVKNECIHMANVVHVILEDVEEIIFKDKKDKIDHAIATEEKIDTLYSAINEYSARIAFSLPKDVLQTLYTYVSLSSDLERIGDKASDLVEFYKLRNSLEQDYDPKLIKELHTMYISAYNAYRLAFSSFVDTENILTAEEKENIKIDVGKISAELRKQEIQFRTTALLQVCKGSHNPQAERAFIDCISSIERIAYRSNKLARKDPAEGVEIG